MLRENETLIRDSRSGVSKFNELSETRAERGKKKKREKRYRTNAMLHKECELTGAIRTKTFIDFETFQRSHAFVYDREAGRSDDVS